MIELADFPMCCGAGVMINLYDQGNGTFEQQIKNAIIKAQNDQWGLLLAITNEDQEIAGPSLLKYGFIITKEFKNPKHDSHLTLWSLDLVSMNLSVLMEPKSKEPVLHTIPKDYFEVPPYDPPDEYEPF